MMLSLFFTVAAALGGAAPAPAPIASSIQDDAAKEAEFQRRFAAAKDDAAKLWELAEWCNEEGLRSQRREAMLRIIELDPNHEGARKGLRHHFYDGKWFESYAEVSAYRREETERMRAQGLERFNDEWVPIADVPYLRMRWVKDETGAWVNPSALARAARDAEFREKGWVQQSDLVWVAPDEVEKWKENLWKCGDQWLSIEDANKYHAEIGRWWTIPGQRFLILSTCAYETALESAKIADRTYDDLVRMFGLQPSRKPEVVVVRSLAQYNDYAQGNQAAGRPRVEANGFSSCHYSFFAEVQFDYSVTPWDYRGGGVGYWDVGNPDLAFFGRLATRHAAAHSYIEAIDPSWRAVSLFLSNPEGQFQEAEFWAEKRIPRWLRYGAASYVERYFQDADAEDPWWTRKWAVENLLRVGKIEPLERIFTFTLDPADTSGRLISQAGLVVSFMLDGRCPPVINAHRKLKAMLTRGEDTKEAVAELQQALSENREAFDAYVKANQPKAAH